MNWMMRMAAGVVVGMSSIVAGEERGERPMMGEFLGVCGHTVLFRPELYRPVAGLVRDYHPVEWDLAGETDRRPEFPFAKNRVNWELVYSSWAKRQFRTDVCLMFETIPAGKWKNLEADFAAYSGEFAREFGPSGKRKLIEAVEIGNEPGKFSDAQYAALLRAGVPALKKADAKLRVATCNLTTGKSGEYAKSVTTLVDAGAEALAGIDVLTIHTYAHAEGYPTWQSSYPEDPGLKYLKDVADLARWRDAHAKGKEIWVTEFGYDATTKRPDPKKEFAKWRGVSELQQAQYLVRSALLFAAMPVDRAYVYFFNDSDEPKLHSSSGITRNFVPKPSYHALAQLQRVLREYRFSRVIAQKEGEVYAYEFEPSDPKKAVIVVAWSPTGNGRREEIVVAVGEGRRVVRGERMMTGADTAGEVLVSERNRVLVEESPVYLFLDAK